MPPMWPPLRASQLLAAFRQILQALLSLKDKIGNAPPKISASVGSSVSFLRYTPQFLTNVVLLFN